jgi:hypothetical protein
VKLLKVADQEVRNIEFSDPDFSKPIENEEVPPIQKEAELPVEFAVTVSSNIEEAASIPERKDPRELQGSTENVADTSLSKYVPKEIVPLPLWLNFESIITYIAKQINIVEKATDMSLNWSAFSVREGYVWVKEDFLFEAVSKTSRENPAVFAAEVDKAVRWNILYTVVKELARRGEAVKEMLKEGCYQAPVTILAGKGKPCSTFMIPFHSGAFGMLPDELEQRKGSVINGMIKNIVPKQQESQT